jgi:hypothetical protein
MAMSVVSCQLIVRPITGFTVTVLHFDTEYFGEVEVSGSEEDTQASSQTGSNTYDQNFGINIGINVQLLVFKSAEPHGETFWC